MEELLYCDAGLHLISLIDVKTLCKLYIYGLDTISKLLNTEHVLNKLIKTHKIISKISCFFEYYAQYIIKYDPKNSPFNDIYIINTALFNDDVDALMNTNHRILGTGVLIESLQLGKEKIYAHCQSLPGSKSFLYGYNGKFKNKTDNQILKLLSNKKLNKQSLISGIIYGKHHKDVEKMLRLIIRTSHSSKYISYLHTIIFHAVRYNYDYTICMKIYNICNKVLPYYDNLINMLLCAYLINEDKVDAIGKIMSAGIITVDELKTVVNSNFKSVNHRILKLIDYDVPHIKDGCLLTVLNEEVDSTDYSYTGSIISLLESLHKEIECYNFRVSLNVYNQAVNAKDVLAINYITKHNLIMSE